jgi:hypothetical protein
MVDQLRGRGADQAVVEAYKRATASLIQAYRRFHAVASRRLASRVDVGVPIGALTSRIVANLALAPLDRHVSSLSQVFCYRRYVDDIAIVAKAQETEIGRVETLRKFLPLLTVSD